jgi:hypothetical protein
MLKGSNSSLQSEFQKLADSQSSNLGKIYESFLKVLLAKHPEKKKGLKVERKPKSKELGIKAEKKSPKDLGLRVENKGKSKIIERGVNEVGKIPEVSPTSLAKESLLPKLLYEYSKDTGKSRVMLSPEEGQAVLELTDKSTKEGDVIKNGADLKISDSNDRVLFETDSKGVVIYSQNQRNPSVLKENGLGSAMDSLRNDLSNVISKAEARKPLGKGVEELNQSAMSLDEELLAKTKSRAVPVERDQDIPRARTEMAKTKAPDPPVQKSMVSPPTVSKTLVIPPVPVSDQEKIRLLNNPGLGLEPGSSVQMKGGSLSVEQHEGTLVVFFSDGERAGEQIASVENGMTKISPQFSEQVASMMQEHIAELPYEAEKAPAEETPEIDDLEAEEEYDHEY